MVAFLAVQPTHNTLELVVQCLDASVGRALPGSPHVEALLAEVLPAEGTVPSMLKHFVPVWEAVTVSFMSRLFSTVLQVGSSATLM